MKVKDRYYCDICLSLHPTTGFNMASYKTTRELFDHVKETHKSTILMWERVANAQEMLDKLQ